MWDAKWWKHSFSEHKAIVTKQGNIEEIIWRKPRTNINSICYLIYGRSLIVRGDLGEAIYQWSSPISLDFLANTSIDYFQGKCQASEYGYKFREWDSRTALKCAKEYITEYQQETEKELPEDFEDDMTYASELGKHEWKSFLNDNHEIFGTEWYESESLMGYEIALRCRTHHLGLKMAYEQIEKLALI